MDPEECMICLEEYSISHMPQLLPCSHMICHICISDLSSGDLECPICRNPYKSSEITPNNDLIEKIMRDELVSFNSFHQQFENRLEEVVQSEIDKQLKCINQLNQLEIETIKTFSNLRKQLNEAMDNNSIVKHETLTKIKQDINSYSLILKDADLRHKEASEIVKMIEQKYLNNDVTLNLKVFSCEAFQKTLNEITLMTSQAKVLVQDKSVCLFSKSTVELVYERPAERRGATNRVNLYTARILFNPMDQNLKMFNMKKRESLSFPHQFIQKESKCIHLHPETVCVVTPDHILYIDINDMSLYYVHFKRLWVGFCLGRHKGDLALIGGSRMNSDHPGREVLVRYKRKEWNNLPELNQERMYATCESLYNKIYVFGGNIDLSIEVFYMNRWRVLQVKLQSSYSHIVSCSDNNFVYLLGGVTETNEVNRVIYRFDSDHLTIAALDTIEYELISDCNVSACLFNNQIFYNTGDSLFQYDLK
jgi:uncharacterized protein (UPF0212 family)